MLESNTLTPLLKRLEKLGFLERRRDAADERQVRVKLTSIGSALREKAREIPSCISDVSGLSDKELAEVRRRHRRPTREPPECSCALRRTSIEGSWFKRSPETTASVPHPNPACHIRGYQSAWRLHLDSELSRRKRARPEDGPFR